MTTPTAEYLVCTAYLDATNVTRLKDNIIKFIRNRERRPEYEQFMNWKQAANEIVVSTTYSGFDITLTKEFGIVLKQPEPAQLEHVHFTIAHCILNEWAPCDAIARGHKHILVLKFPSGIPRMLTELPSITQQQLHTRNNYVVICSVQDLTAVQQELSTSEQSRRTQ